MRAVLGKEQYADDGKEADEDKPGPRGQKAGLLRSSMARVILMGHMRLLFDDCCHCDPICKNYGLRELSACAPHGVTIIIPGACVFRFRSAMRFWGNLLHRS